MLTTYFMRGFHFHQWWHLPNQFGNNSVIVVDFLQQSNLKPGLHEPQLQVEWGVTLLYSIVVETSLDYKRIN